MFDTLNDLFEPVNCEYEIEANGEKQRQTIGHPKMAHMQNFMSLVEQASRMASPARVKISYTIYIPEYEGICKGHDLVNTIEFKNNAYISRYGE